MLDKLPNRISPKGFKVQTLDHVRYEVDDHSIGFPIAAKGVSYAEPMVCNRAEAVSNEVVCRATFVGSGLSPFTPLNGFDGGNCPINRKKQFSVANLRRRSAYDPSGRRVEWLRKQLSHLVIRKDCPQVR